MGGMAQERHDPFLQIQQPVALQGCGQCKNTRTLPHSCQPDQTEYETSPESRVLNKLVLIYFAAKVQPLRTLAVFFDPSRRSG
jgi:hypothetical protein